MDSDVFFDEKEASPRGVQHFSLNGLDAVLLQGSASHEEAFKVLRQRGYDFPSLGQLASMRIAEEFKPTVAHRLCRAKEHILYTVNNSPRLVRSLPTYIPLRGNALGETYVSDAEIEKMEEHSFSLNFPKGGPLFLPLENMESCPITQWLFGRETAQQYAAYLQPKHVRGVTIQHFGQDFPGFAHKEGHAIVRPVYLDAEKGLSEISLQMKMNLGNAEDVLLVRKKEE